MAHTWQGGEVVVGAPLCWQHNCYLSSHHMRVERNHSERLDPGEHKPETTGCETWGQ